MDFREELLARGRELQWHPRVHAGALRELGQRPERRLVRQPPALLRRAVPGVVSARRRRPRRLRARRSLPDEDRLPIDPSTDVPDGYRAEQRGAAGRLRRRSRRDGHLGDLVADAADRRAAGRTIRSCSRETFPMDLRPQAHDIIRTWLFDTCCARTSSTTRCRGRTRRSPGWVLDPDRKKMSKSKGNVVTPMALLEEHGSDGVRYWAASGRPGHRHRVRSQPDEGRPPAGDQGAQRVEVRAGAAEPQGADRRAGRSRDAAAAWRRSSTRRPTRSRRTTTRARCSGPRPSSGGSATTTSSSSRGGATASRAPTAPASANAALTAALSVLLRLFAPFLPFVTEEVWSWWQDGIDSHGGVAGARTSSTSLLADSARTRPRCRSGDLRVGDRGAVRGAQAAVRGEAAAEGADHQGDGRRPEPGDAMRRARCRRVERRDLATSRARDVARRVRDARRASRARSLASSEPRCDEACCRSARSIPRVVPRHRPPRARRGCRRRRRHHRRDGRAPTSARAACSSSRRDCVLAGLDVALEAFRQLEPGVAGARCAQHDGDACEPGDDDRRGRRLGARRCSSASARRSISCSGCPASRRRARQFVDAAGGRIIILDTRKTTPTLRALEKYAVRAGGGDQPSRRPVRRRADQGQPRPPRRRRRRRRSPRVRERSAGPADRGRGADACRGRRGARGRRRHHAASTTCRPTTSAKPCGARAAARKIEISGGVTLERMPELAATGADFVSVGALTHSAPAVDISFEIEPF